MAFGGILSQFSTAEWCTIVVPVALYWTFSTFFYVLSSLNLTTVNLHKIPMAGRPKNKVSVSEVIQAVLTQHLLQMSLAVGLNIVLRDGSEGEREMEVWWLFLVKLAIGVMFMDTWQVRLLQLFSLLHFSSLPFIF
jgi:hypothetical protein